MKTSVLFFSMATLLVALGAGCGSSKQDSSANEAARADSMAKALMSDEAMVERGKYLVTVGGCDDCHSPKIMTDKGPEFDMSKRLSGHPAGSPMPSYDASDIAPGKWFLTTQDLTAWVGPWGVSFPANLTPDTATGTGAWTEELFIRIIRSGFHMGVEGGRPILPPMPWQNFAQMTDEDLKAVFAFLKSLPPINNKVPEPLPPGGKS
jgi:hypothetical protein